MKRTNGYVVGRKTVRGIPTWSVKVQDDSHPLNGQKLNVVGNAPNLRPALDVDFLVLEQGGLSIAADVSPRGVVSAHEEGIKQMRKSAWKMVAALVALMLIIGSGAAWFTKPWKIKSLQDQFLEFKVASVLNKFEGMSFVDMVPDSVVRQAVLDPIGGTYGARKAVWDKFLCGPVWNQKHDDMLDGHHNSKCFDALYSSGHVGPDNVLYRDAGIPLSVAPMIEKMRSFAAETARGYLLNPDRLVDFYKVRKNVAIKAFLEMDPEERPWRIEELRSMKNTIELFIDSTEVRQLHRAYIQAEHDWMAWVDSGKDSSIPPIK